MKDQYWWVKKSVDVTGSLKELPMGEIVEGECKDFASKSAIVNAAWRLNKANEEAGRGAAVAVEITANDTHFKIEKLNDCVGSKSEEE